MTERAAKQPRLDPEVAANVIIQFESAEGEHAGRWMRTALGPPETAWHTPHAHTRKRFTAVPLCSPMYIHTGPTLDVPHTVTPQQLEVLLNGLLQNEEKMPYSFYIEGQVCFCGPLCLVSVSARPFLVPAAATTSQAA